MKKLFEKLKEWATDYPKEPEETLVELFFPKGPTIAAHVLKNGLPFHIRWVSEGIREDN